MHLMNSHENFFIDYLLCVVFFARNTFHETYQMKSHLFENVSRSVLYVE